MLLKGCAVILILTFQNFLLCDAEEFNRKNTTDTAIYSNTFAFTPNKHLRNPTNRVKLKYRRSAIEHSPVTEDGYVLKIFRLPSNFTNATKKYPVLLVHGLFQSSDRFLNQNKNQSIAYKLQELGYDVWLFNARGNKYSRGHNKLSPETNKTDYFNYSYEEIACFDLAATVDYIISLTTVEKIHYIGHSLGATFFLVLNSLVPKYNDKFDRAFLMAPLGYHKSIPRENLHKEFNDPFKLHKALIKVGTMEVFPYDTTEKQVDFIPKNCLGDITWETICNELQIQTIMGLKEDNNTMFDTRGGSIKTLMHWAQNIKTKKFRRWDFGKSNNDNKYGVGKNPPDFPLDIITVPIRIIYASTDDMVNDVDIEKLAMKLQYATTRKLEIDSFQHDDFLAGKYIMSDVYDDIIRDLEYENPQLSVQALDTTTTASTPSSGNALAEFPWTAVLSLVSLLLFICLQVANCFTKKPKPKKGPTSTSRTTASSTQRS